MEVGYCRMVTISTDNLLQTMEYRSGVGAHWPFLSYPEGKVRDDLDIAEYTDPLHNPMIPHTIVLEPGLVVFKCHNGYWYFARPTVEELRHDLRDVLRRCRPDWDLSEPETQSGVGPRREKSLLSVRQESVEKSRSIGSERSIDTE